MPRHVAVIDIGKTNAKVALVEVDADGVEKAVRRTPNTVLRDGPYPHFDTERLWAFILASLGELNRERKIDAIVTTTHGATAALVNADGGLALPILDYEHDGPDSLAADYDAVRPPFAESGSPRLPIGLNLGAQLFWQAKSFPDAFARAAHILMYPQYWAFRLCGVRANEVTSLGCHTDLWDYRSGDFSTLVDRMGWRRLMAPVRRAHDALGSLLPEVAASTGIAPGTPVLCGIHDSNATLLPHLIFRSDQIAVVSTGTWVIAMTMGGQTIELDPTRDTLMNVNAFGRPVPSARFMGGREFEMMVGANPELPTDADIENVLLREIMLLPSVQQGSGPFPNRTANWVGEEPHGGQRTAAVSFYLAMMTATALQLVGSRGVSFVEGPLASNNAFTHMLSAATRDFVMPVANTTGTSVGAALLIVRAREELRLVFKTPLRVSSQGSEWSAYATRWRRLVGSAQG